MAIAALGLRRAQHRGAARRAVPDGRALDVLRARQVRPAAGSARRHGAGRRQRAGRDGHVRRDPARHARGRPAGRARAASARSSRDADRDCGRRDSRSASRFRRCARGAGLAHRLATVDLDVGQHPRRARIARRVPVDPRHLVVLVLRRAGARAVAAVSRRTCSAAASRSSRCCWSLFSAGVGIGSLLCERLSGRKVEIGLVPFGSIGLTVFAVDLYFATPRSPARHRAERCAVRRAAGLVARADRSRPDRRVRRLLHRAALRARAAALAPRSDVARHRREQHPERRLHGRGRGPRRRSR